jgi:hypothetical protein
MYAREVFFTMPLLDIYCAVCVGPVLVDTGGTLIIRLGEPHVKQKKASTARI